MRRVGKFQVSEEQLSKWVDTFLPLNEPFYFQSQELADKLLQTGMVVYTHPEFKKSFPGFFLSYGGTYSLWNVPQHAYVWMDG